MSPCRFALFRWCVARAALWTALSALLAFASAPEAHAGALQRELDRAFADVDVARVSSGFLLDRALPFARMERFDGTSGAPAATSAALRQIVDELHRASLGALAAQSANALRARGRAAAEGAPIPLGVVDVRAQRIRATAASDGSLRVEEGRVELDSAALEEVRVFAAAALVEETRRGATTRFVLPRDLWMAPGRPAPSRVELDLGDGRGLRVVRFDEPIAAGWAAPGRREIALRATWQDGETRLARFGFDVIRMGTPAPSDTLVVNAAVPYDGVAGSGRAYVYLAPGHVAIENPIVVVEGFDLDDSMSWDKLYELLNQENLLEDLRAAGFDAVVLDFDSATDPIQRNAFVVAELLQQVAQTIDPAQRVFLVGASMGGLCARYALLWLESQAIDVRVRTYLSFDAPHSGANIPLGLQYWLDFFSDQSVDAAFLLSRLDTPAARQLLAYHHTTPPGSTGAPDPLRGTLLADFAALGDWPVGARRVALANGSGFGTNQGFSAGQQVILYHYTSFLVNIDGNVWAVPNPGPTQIFHGNIDFIFLPADIMNVTVSGSSPWDNAPGGNRDSMHQMDTTAVPYGDIVSLHDRHCFVPTISALALDTTDLFFDVAGATDLLAHTPFAAVRFASGNEEHIFVGPEEKAWILAEVLAGPTSVPALATSSPATLRLQPAFPNPFHEAVTIRFALDRESKVTLELFDVAGRRVARPLEGVGLPSGQHSVRWSAPASGVYYYRVRAGKSQAAGRLAAVG